MTAHRNSWSDSDDRRLQQVWSDASFTIENIARSMGRSTEAVRRRAARIELPPRRAGMVRHKAADVWNKDTIAELLRLRATGLSGRQIAAQMNRDLGSNLTRNQVIGKLYRLEAMALPGASAPRAVAKVKRPAQSNVVSLPGNSATTAKGGALPPWRRIRAETWRPIEGFEPVALEDRPTRGCRWPIDVEGAGEGRYFCCGRDTASTYCETHQEMSRSRWRTDAQDRADLSRKYKARQRQHHRRAA